MSKPPFEWDAQNNRLLITGRLNEVIFSKADLSSLIIDQTVIDEVRIRDSITHNAQINGTEVKYIQAEYNRLHNGQLSNNYVAKITPPGALTYNYPPIVQSYKYNPGYHTVVTVKSPPTLPPEPVLVEEPFKINRKPKWTL